MTKPSKPRPKKAPLTDAERHELFKAMADDLKADDSEEAFDKAFAKIVSAPAPQS